jgi:hypothetical protein
MPLPLYIADRKRRIAAHALCPGWVISGPSWVEPTVAAAELGRDPVELFDQVQDDVAGFLRRHARFVERLADALFLKGEVRGPELARLLRMPAHHDPQFANLSPEDAEMAREFEERRRREREPRIPRHLI